MGYGIKLKLVECCGTAAKYQYGLNLDPLDGLFETDVTKVISGEGSGDIGMDQVVNVIKPCTGETAHLSNAIRAFTAVYRHYKRTGAYMLEGGYY